MGWVRAKAGFILGTPLFDLVKKAAAEDSLTQLTPVIEKQASLTPFTAAAVMRIIELANEGVFDKTASLEICKLLLLKSVFDTMSLTKLRTVETAEAEFRNASKSRSNGYPYYQMRPIRDGPHQNPETYITPNFLAECLARCIELNWDDLAMRFSPIIAANIAQRQPTFLSLLPRYQELALAVLEAYLEKQVGKEPGGAEAYSGQGLVRCSCGDCADLNRFLKGGQRVWSLRAAE
ncbi:hypothetical protein QC763_0096690 [Podospora pseudopauciseta]|uniref:Uncharacterized protein n=1 Tax=Podospora pseudopauciseta TaxID=2093780 RepID=A0ABR0H5I4_9PEZI|nr:hypothetical protein QC763_0096690 [Podospora pseudopauciseta]